MSLIHMAYIQLSDNWPGYPAITDGVPPDGWDGTSHHGVSEAPAYPPGTKIQAYSDNSHAQGYYTMMYGALAGYSSLSHNIEAGSICTLQTGAGICAKADMTPDASITADSTYKYPYASGDGTNMTWWTMHVCQSAGHTDLSQGGRVCIPCGTMSAGQYGWFWVGGVCPVSDVTFFDATAGDGSGHDLTCSDTLIGPFMFCSTAACTELLDADATDNYNDDASVNHLPHGFISKPPI